MRYEYKSLHISKDNEININELNKLGQERWKLIAIWNGWAVLRRPIGRVEYKVKTNSKGQPVRIVREEK